MGILDRVLLGGAHADPADRVRREDVFVVAVQCTQAGGTCFCASMGTGPTAESGYDLALTEVLEDGRHYFVLDAGSERGAELLAEVELAARRAPPSRTRPRRGRASGGRADGTRAAGR